MKFLIDAQLPRRMTSWFASHGCDALHTLDLPNGNRTADNDVIDYADRDGRIVVTKDADFVDSHLLNGRPGKLLLISAGNLRNQELEVLVVPLIPALVRNFTMFSFLELGPNGILIRD